MTISQILLVGSEGRLALLDEPTTIELMELAAGAQTLLEGVDVPPGRYSQMQVVVDDAKIAVQVDGEEKVFATDDADADGALLVPSWETSGFKALLPSGGLVVSGTQRFLVVTLDLAESFGRDAAGDWMMTPVFRALEVGMTADLVVDVWAGEGTLDDFMVIVRDEGGNAERLSPLVASADSRWDAHFLYLDPAEGPYFVDLVAPDGVSFTTSLVGPFYVRPESGETDTLAIRVTEITR